MNLKKINGLKFLLTFFTLSIILDLIKSQNLCPFSELDDMLQYYAKGINPSKCDKCIESEYKWQYIHCVNNYSNATYLAHDDKDDYFNQNAGVSIGSSINIAKFTKEFINTNLSKLKETDKANLIKLIDKYGDEAEAIHKNITFDFSLDEINYINEKVYEEYYKEMMDYFEPLSLRKKNYGFSFELNLLTFFVKYYGMNDYLSQAKECLQENKNSNLLLLSYFFLNIRSVYYNQKKLWSLVTLSSDEKYCNYNISLIGIYHDSRLKYENSDDFKIFLEELVSSFESKEYYYSLGNMTGLYFDEPKGKEEFYDLLDKYDLYNNKSIRDEDINKGIQYFENVFNKSIKGVHSFYQRHLIIFLNDIERIHRKINIDYFTTNGIQVILVAKINKKSDEERINGFFDDNFNIITFYDYTKLNTSLKYLRGAINFNVQKYSYEDISEKIRINNIITSSDDNMQYFRIKFNKELINLNEDFYYFHISLIYNDPKKIEILYKNNSNITFLVSQKNPYADIKSYDIINFCFNTTVSSSENNSPYINYIINDKTNDYFYISIMANDVSYSLTINFENSNVEPQKSNGEYSYGRISPFESELVETYSDKIIQSRCTVDYFSLLKYYSSGVHYTNKIDIFNKIIDMNMMECLYKNVYGPFFEIENGEEKHTKLEDGPLIGYGIYLSRESCVKLKRDKVPLYIINKLYPFLSNSIEIKKAAETLENYNLNLTYEEVSILNINHLSNIVNDLEKFHPKFLNLSDNTKLAIILRIIEQHSSSQQIKQYLDYLSSNNIDKYLQVLNTTMRSRMSTENSLNFQMMLTQTKNIYKPKKCLLSIVIGKTLLWSDEFFELISKINNYRISITYYDPEINQTELLTDFTEDIDEIQEKIMDIKNTSTFERIDIIDINSVLKKQKDLFKYYDEGIKKCIVIVSTRDAIRYKYEFTKPNEDLLKELNEVGILLFDYSDHINFIDDDNYDHNNFFNSTKSKYIQFVPFLNYSDMGNNYLSLTNMINRYPIPINKIEDIYLDLEPDEEIFFEFNLHNELTKLWGANNEWTDYNKLRFNFDITGIKIYFSDKFIYPNNYSNDVNFLIDEKTSKFFYELKHDDKNNHTFFMAIQTSNKVDNSFVALDLCDNNENCLKRNFYFKFYISFIVIGISILFYGTYICFCETTFKKESNIFERK